MALQTYICTDELCQRKNTVDVIGEPEDYIRIRCPGCSTDETTEFVIATKKNEEFHPHPT